MSKVDHVKTWFFYRQLGAWLLVCLTLVAAGCGTRSTPTEGQNYLDQAAVEATAIIQQARATALMIQAQAEATAMVEKALREAEDEAQDEIPTRIPPTNPPVTQNDQVEGAAETPLVTEMPGVQTAQLTPLAAQDGIAILSVSYGAGGAYIVVNFIARPEIASTFWPGVLSVTDEANGNLYAEVPVMPVIGPLIARPREDGQLGYFMLINAPAPIQPGSLVTVIMGEYKFEHIPIQ
jgi:hypothetical protein